MCEADNVEMLCRDQEKVCVQLASLCTLMCIKYLTITSFCIYDRTLVCTMRQNTHTAAVSWAVVLHCVNAGWNVRGGHILCF